VRSFPGAARRRTAAAAMVAVALGGLVVPATAGPSAAGDDLKHRHHQVQKKQRHVHQDLEESSRALRQAAARLQRARRTLRAARVDLRAVQRRLDRAESGHAVIVADLRRQQRRLAEARGDLQDGDQQAERQRSQLRRLILDGYHSGDPRLVGLAGLMSGDTTLADLTRTAEYDAVVTTTESDSLQRLDAQVVLLGVRTDNVKELRDDVAVKERRAARTVTAIKELRTSKARHAGRVRTLVGQRTRATAAAARAKARDRRELARLKVRERRLLRLIMARHGLSRRVATLDGFLRRPVPGIVTSPFGMRRHPIYGYRGLHNGTDFRAPCGRPLRASQTGKVMATYFSPVWGKRLYLSLGRVNGRHVTVVYNHISRYAVRKGSVVAPGRVVAYAGSTGWSTACHLHYTVLVDGRAVNPARYL